MAEEIIIIHNGAKHRVNLAQCSKLVGLAKTTFSRYWRMYKARDLSDQESFDMIKKECSAKTKRRADANPEGRKNKKITRRESEINQRIKPWLDRFLLGVA